MEYDLELEKAAEHIKQENAKSVCVQLPDGLKPLADKIVDFLSEKTGASVVIWAGSCFGACDTPNIPDDQFDLLIQWGHSAWKR